MAEIWFPDEDKPSVKDLLKGAATLPNTSRSLWSQNERTLIEFAKKLAVALEEATRPLKAGPDDAFQCTSEHAVELAYMMSMAEGVYQHPLMEKEGGYHFEVMEPLENYLRGDASPPEIIQELTEWFNELEAASKKADAGDKVHGSSSDPGS